MKRKRVCLSLVLLASCGGGDPSEAPESGVDSAPPPAREEALAPQGEAGTGTPTEPEPSVASELGDPSTWTGRIEGRITFFGEELKPKILDTGGDPTCDAMHPEGLVNEMFVLGEDQGLANVVVYISRGVPDIEFEPPSEPVYLRQKGCVYTPHVVAVQAGQKLIVTNEDPVVHNVHARPRRNQESNESQQVGAEPLEFVFEKRDIVIPFQCDLHPWMLAYVGVIEHPFFDVTDANGRFVIEGLPPGSYRLTAGHEALGAERTEFVLEEGQTLQVNMRFERS